METLTLANKAYQIIGAGYFCATILYTEDLVAKVFFNKGEAAREYKALKYASKINNLLCSPVELIDCWDYHLLVLERLEPVNWDKVFNKQEMLEKARFQLYQLNLAGFTHNDIKRPEGCDTLWDNVIVTSTGIRLVDAGLAYIEEEYKSSHFWGCMQKDQEDFTEWGEVFLS